MEGTFGRGGTVSGWMVPSPVCIDLTDTRIPEPANRHTSLPIGIKQVLGPTAVYKDGSNSCEGGTTPDFSWMKWNFFLLNHFSNLFKKYIKKLWLLIDYLVFSQSCDFLVGLQCHTSKSKALLNLLNLHLFAGELWKCGINIADEI